MVGGPHTAEARMPSSHRRTRTVHAHPKPTRDRRGLGHRRGGRPRATSSCERRPSGRSTTLANTSRAACRLSTEPAPLPIYNYCQYLSAQSAGRSVAERAKTLPKSQRRNPPVYRAYHSPFTPRQNRLVLTCAAASSPGDRSRARQFVPILTGIHRSGGRPPSVAREPRHLGNSEEGTTPTRAGCLPLR
jgi:hypothetical protein